MIRRSSAALLSALVPLLLAAESSAAPRPCRFGFKGMYIDWSKTSSAEGRGQFIPRAGRASVLPDFTWTVSGKPLSIRIGTNEPFSGGNSMKGFYGQADDENNLNVRIEANEAPPRKPIPHDVEVKLVFDAGTPASGWAFAVVDIDVDQVRFTARDTSGNPVPTKTIAAWFQQQFDANPSEDGVNIPSWDSANAAVVGSESSSTKLRTTIEGGLTDTEAASAWFQPNVSLSELSFVYQSIQEDATPSFHIFVAACETNVLAPTPTPAAVGDSDGDTIPDAEEGTGDPDNDMLPDYLDEDSDGDTVPDSLEGTEDPDGDNIPNYLDGDSDGDDVPDIIERDPDAITPEEANADDDRDGIDDGREDRTDDPLIDTDTDGEPDSADSDSDNDGENDGDEAYDLDGDGERDVTPSGEDTDGNGIDDNFDNFDSPDDLSPDYSDASTESPCTAVRLTTTKARVLRRLNDLAARTPKFALRAAACGDSAVKPLISSAAATRRAFSRLLSSAYNDKELSCPASVCAIVKRRQVKERLATLARRLAASSRASKLAAISACGEPPGDGSTEQRPRTETYLAQLQKEIAKLPAEVNRCS